MSKAAKWWRGLAGAARYFTGAPASADEMIRRATICASCPTAQARQDDIESSIIAAVFGKPLFWTCGPALEEKPGEYCGCLVLAETPSSWVSITVKGKAVHVEAAGKTRVHAERCPQGRW